MFLDFYDVLTKPPLGFKLMLCDVLGFDVDVDCIVDGLRRIKCGENYVYTLNVVHAPKYSPYRKNRSTVSSVSRLVEKLVKLRDLGVDYLINVDLTIPKEYSLVYALDECGLKILKKAFKKFIKKLEKKYSGELGYLYNVHVWGTRTLEPHFHIHLSIVNAVFKDGELIRFRPWINADKLRELWLECLSECGLNVDKIDVKIGYCKISNRSAVVHRLKYASRSPLVDMASYYLNHTYVDLDSLKRRWFGKLLSYVNRRVLGGFLRRLSKIVGDIGKSGNFCPICGRRVKKGFKVSFSDDELIENFKDGILNIVYWNPTDRWYYIVHSRECNYNALVKWLETNRI